MPTVNVEVSDLQIEEATKAEIKSLKRQISSLKAKVDTLQSQLKERDEKLASVRKVYNKFREIAAEHLDLFTEYGL